MRRRAGVGAEPKLEIDRIYVTPIGGEATCDVCKQPIERGQVMREQYGDRWDGKKIVKAYKRHNACFLAERIKEREGSK